MSVAERTRANRLSNSALQNRIDDAIAQLELLRLSPICTQSRVDHHNPDDLDALRELSMLFAKVADPLLRWCAYEAELYVKDHYSIASDAIDGNLEFEIRRKADGLREAFTSVDPNDEHRLTKRELL